MKLDLPEIIYSSSNSQESRKIGQLLKDGKIKKLLPKAYTSNLTDDDEVIIKRHLFQLISKHYPGALLSHRTALEYQVSPKGNVYLTSSQNRVVRWPGVILKFTKGSEPLPNDNPLYNDLYVSSQERAFLENLSSSRITGGEYKTVPEDVIEEKLLLFLNTAGEKKLNELRDKSREISEKLGLVKEFALLNKKIGAILSTKPSKILKSPVAMAQSFGEPYDPNRLKLFEKLVGALKTTPLKTYDDNATNEEEFRTFAFFESYFSNYIEGTRFEIDEAVDIIYKNQIIVNRSGDTHDIRGTFEICSNKFEMSKTPSTPEEFIDILRRRHETILGGRPDKKPGIFKELANRAGNTHFVIPKMVSGTLKTGFELMGSIPSAIGKAIYMMFLVSEVHPFKDGNGRIARIMMNAELVKNSEQRIIIPNVYRDDYLGALRKITREHNPDLYIKTMLRAQEYSLWLSPASFDTMLKQLENSSAFEEPNEGVLKWR
ncbi:Fic family protein [Flavivirga aquimarina]|uniref:Fic family protein n=1 Tax=Flavivirga aquimarina TaxID=2027862 RepID=A0ABT8WFK9_9FLAO|nr:Fic family protein [Flavivirga aquimarina]MDO5971898.1 Fic family protein [Flavivirga aquimarina]